MASSRRWVPPLLAAAVVASVLTTQAPGAVTAADLEVGVLVSPDGRFRAFLNGETATMTSLRFYVGMQVGNRGPDRANVRLRFELPAGLDWRDEDPPDPSEGCTEGKNVTCTVPFTLDPNDQANSSYGWAWPVIADRPGRYSLRAEVADLSTSDPDAANNAATVTVVVQPAAGPTGPTAGSATLSPARPSAGAVVTASVRVRFGGAPIRPTRVACAAKIGPRKLKGTPRAASGTARCAYRTPRSAKGQMLRGSVSFTARGQRFTRRFATRLR